MKILKDFNEELHTKENAELFMHLINNDKYTSDRIFTIIMMVKYITGLTNEKILENVKDTNVYRWIIEKNKTILYDSFPSNLEEMVNEWKEKNIPIINKITVRQISNSYRWVKDIRD